MAKADEMVVLHPAVRWWSAYDPSVKCDLASVAYRSLKGWVLIDPIELEKEALQSLLDEAPLIAVFLTNENHTRASGFYREKFKIPVWSSKKAAEKLEIRVDSTFEEVSHHDLEVVEIPGATEGEVVFVAPEGIAILGDAIVNLPGCEFSLLPAKYAWDEKQNRVSLRKLIDFPIEILIFAHGSPIRGKISEKLEALLHE